MRSVVLAGALVAIACSPPALAADCHAMIAQFNANNASSAALQKQVTELDSCDPKWLAAETQRDEIFTQQIALRARLEQSCMSILKGGNSLAELQTMGSDLHKTLTLNKAACATEDELGDFGDDDDDDDE